MAITVTTVLNGGGVPSSGVNTTASWTPDGTSQYILTISSYVSAGSVVPAISSVSGNGLTWTQLKVVNGDNTGTDRTAQYMYVVPAGGSAGTITINWSTVPSVVSWVLDKVAGADSSFGSGTMPQAAVSATSSGANPSATLGSALTSGSVTYAAADFESSAGTLSAGTGYTALGQNTSQSLAWSFTEWNSAGSTTAAANNSTVSNRHSIILIEIPIAASSNNWTQNPTDTMGLTDSVTVGLVLSQNPTDTMGLTDTGVRIDHTLTGTDPVGLTDTTALSQSKSITDTMGLTDSVVVVGPQKYLTGVSSNGRYFVDQNGNPFLVRGDSPWALPVKLSSTEVDTYLANRVSYGFNTLIMSMCGNTVNGGPSDNGATYDGILPFTGGDPSVFNSAYWSRMDTYMAKIRDAGMSLILYPIDGWTTLSGGVFDPATITTTQAQSYGNQLATRYPQSTFPNISWCFGGDYSETTAINNLFNACLTGIRATGDTRLVSVQLMYEFSESDNSTFWEPKVNWDFIYNYRVTYKGISDGYNHSWTTGANPKPALLGEAAYDGSTDANHPGTALVLRRQAGWALTSGSPGEMAGQEGVWNFTSGWASLLSSTAMNQLKAIRDAVQNVAWWKLVPDDSNVLVTAGRGTRVTTDSATYPTGNTYVTAGRAADKSLAVIYLPDATSAITVDMSQIGSSPTATWVDPTNGATSSATVGSTYSHTANAAGSTDWLLILTGTPAGSNFTQNPTDTMGLTDSVTIVLTHTVTPTDPVGLTDTTVIDQIKVITDTVGLTDTVSITQTKVVTDDAGLTDQTIVSVGLQRTFTDDAGLTDTTSQSLSPVNTDTMGLTDNVDVQLSSAGAQLVNDSMGLTDSVVIDRTIVTTDTVGLTDTAVAGLIKTLSVTDTQGLTDATALSIGQTVSDTLGLTDAATLVSSLTRSFVDTVGLTDAAIMELGKAITDVFGLTDNVTVTITKSVTVTDTQGLTDTVALARTIAITDIIGLTDSVVLSGSAGTVIEGLRADITGVGIVLRINGGPALAMVNTGAGVALVNTGLGNPPALIQGVSN